MAFFLIVCDNITENNAICIDRQDITINLCAKTCCQDIIGLMCCAQNVARIA